MWKRVKSDPILTPSTEINSKWISNLNVRTKTIQLTTEISHLCDFGLDNDFLAKYQKMKQKQRVWNSLKCRTFHLLKNTIKKLKTQPKEWMKIRTNHISKRFISRIYEEYLKLNNICSNMDGSREYHTK